MASHASFGGYEPIRVRGMTKNEFKLDNWQRRVLEQEGNITIRAGRQVGKSTVIAIKAAEFAASHPKTVTLVIAASQRQSSLLFEKIRGEVDLLVKKRRAKYKEQPTLTRILLKNGAKIYALPAGRTGYFIRGFTIDLLICDEAAYIPEEVWRAVIPMIAVSRKVRKLGWLILLSTPFGKGGYFYDSFHDKDFYQVHVSSEDCPRIPKDFLAKERQRMTKAEYAQEYRGEFIDEWNQFFPTQLIKKCMTFIDWNFGKDYNPRYSYYLGLDIAHYGGDENAFVISEINNGTKELRIVKCIVTERKAITETVGRVKELDTRFHFRKIFIDDAGVGAGASDMLIEEFGRRVVGMNNAKRSIDTTGTKGRILKEDMYSNALVLMEAGKVEMVSDLKLLKSLKSIIYEYTSEKRLKLFGKYSHLAEAFVRACWCVKERGLGLFIA